MLCKIRITKRLCNWWNPYIYIYILCKDNTYDPEKHFLYYYTHTGNWNSGSRWWSIINTLPGTHPNTCYAIEGWMGIATVTNPVQIELRFILRFINWIQKSLTKHLWVHSSCSVWYCQSWVNTSLTDSNHGPQKDESIPSHVNGTWAYHSVSICVLFNQTKSYQNDQIPSKIKHTKFQIITIYFVLVRSDRS